MINDNLPPVNIEAEEAILGGILLDPEAMVRVADILVKEAFSLQSHQQIYHAAQILHGQGKPTDLMAVSTYLADHNLLEDVGGTTKLAQLVNRTVSAVNIDRYANLVMNKYARRQLITAGHEIVDLGYDTTQDLEVVLDQSEQKIFRLSQERPQQGLIAISDTLINAFNTIEELHQETALPGIPSGFYDLDAITSGFSRSDLIILAGRPSMGKCLAADSELVCQDGSIKTIEEIYKARQDYILTLQSDYKFTWTKPSAFIDDGIKPLYQLTTRLGKKITTTLTHPFLTIQGWRSLGTLQVGNKIAVPRQINVFGKNKIAEEEVKLLAYLIGDGCLTKACPEFTNSNSLLGDDFALAVSVFPELTTTTNNSNGKRTTSIRVIKDQNFIKKNCRKFAQKLQAVITNQDKSLNQIATSLKVNPSVISSWLKGASVPNENILAELCNLLKIEVKDIAPYGILAISKNSPNALTLLLKKLGLWGKDANNKTIPQVIFKLQPDLIALFINRLFANDGWATVLKSGQSQLGYATVSEKLARQIQHLLLRFGIVAALKERSVKYKNSNRQVWQLDITDTKSIKNFIDEIGIFGKEEAINKVREVISQRRYQTNQDLIPLEIRQELKQAKKKESWMALARGCIPKTLRVEGRLRELVSPVKKAGIKGYGNIDVNKRALSRERLFQLAYALDNIPLQNLATREIYWDEIVSIEALGKGQVYDLTIPETHNFVANDICVHNTALGLNIGQNIAKKQQLPIAIFSLEMSREQLAQRMLASESKIASNRLRSGRISQNEIESLVDGVGTLSELPIYIDDTANLSIMQMRSQVRRLQGQLKSELGLVLLDYLQLMEGSGSENRVQELSKITRSLKGLAREVNVPIIALSQLSRGVEQRNNKRPMLSDLRESGCLSGDTLVTLDNGLEVPIRDLSKSSGFTVLSLDNTTNKIEPALVINAFCTGIKPVFRLTTALGRTIDATANHKFFTINGWSRLDNLDIGQNIAIPRLIDISSHQTMSNEELALLGHLIGDGCTLPSHAIQYTTRERDLAEIVVELAKKVFKDKINPRINSERQWYQVYLSANYHLTHNQKNPVTQWLENLNIFGLRSYEKFIPDRVFQQPQLAISIFLRHLWTTDGCIKLVKGKRPRPILYYATSSKKLAHNVQSLLLRIEINSRISQHSQKEKGRNQYHVTITGKYDIEKFDKLIGTVGKYKQQELKIISNYMASYVANTNRDIIPKDIWRVYAVPAMQENGITTRQMQASLGISYCGTSLYKQNISRDRAIKLANAVKSETIAKLADSDIYWDKINKIEYIGETDVYDLTVPKYHNFIANNIIVHNSIEQDADLVIMLYRDEYYNPDTPDRGIAEAIIVKHRNGPVGTVKLIFQGEFTKFESLARPSNY